MAAVSGRPILITGSHRSGTTWVGRTLAAGGTLGYIDEPFSVLHRPGILSARFDDWFPYVTNGDGAVLRPHVERMLRFRYDHAAELRAIRGPRDAGRMARDAARFRSYGRRALRPLVKDPIALLAAGWLAKEFDMQVVVMIRHPAAFAGSLKRMGWTHPFSDFQHQPALMAGPLAAYRDRVDRFAAQDQDVVDQAALLWAMLHDVIDGYRHRHPDWLFVRHEDLSREPQQRFADLCLRLDVPFDGGVAEYLDSHTGGGNPAEAASGKAHELRRDSRANVDNWRARLTPDEVKRVREATAGVAERFYGEDEW
jgi:hypothetical protein